MKNETTITFLLYLLILSYYPCQALQESKTVDTKSKVLENSDEGTMPLDCANKNRHEFSDCFATTYGSKDKYSILCNTIASLTTKISLTVIVCFIIGNYVGYRIHALRRA